MGEGGGWAKACECVRKCTLLESGAYYWIEKYAILAGQQPQAHLFSHALESEQCTPTPNGPGASVQAGGLRAAFPVLCAFAALPRAGIWAGAYAPAPALGDFRPALAGGFHPALVALPPATVPPATIWTALKLCTAVAARITPTPMYQK